MILPVEFSGLWLIFCRVAAASARGPTLRFQLDPSPSAPRDQIRHKEPRALAKIVVNEDEASEIMHGLGT